ncbi:3-methyl-2-oxobutanoate hydroxymethyltransferase [Acetobacteraceae bacterium KSS8]|uniref:3-methyl-2-oxobutanoate hydroxymethyltransferase n=1 Tax=Endosaccharibacter trunci TaxID=2812733 RepID=A0ABT1W861_9PROT|nr:3-methyl-2-oxobutanoate hydroxymethyltransferase [Acetobacteraceae bacterium KSS8]
MRFTVRDIGAMKQAGERIVMLTAYDHPSAALAEAAGVRFLLVGDSLGMVVLGRDSTLPVTIGDMVHHAEAVVRGAPNALVVGDLPFLTYACPEDAVAAARALMQQAGVQAVKLEGGAALAPIVRHLTTLGVPVMGHLGFTPQAMHQVGVRVQAKEAAEARRLLDDALALQDAGAFAVVLELVPAPLAEAVSARLRIPTIGIGAGAGCDGQVQVWHDLLGLSLQKPPRHARVYAPVGEMIRDAIAAYAADVRDGSFPTAANSARMDQAELDRALGRDDR